MIHTRKCAIALVLLVLLVPGVVAADGSTTTTTAAANNSTTTSSTTTSESATTQKEPRRSASDQAQQIDVNNSTVASYLEKPTAVGDSALHIIDWWKADGVMHIKVFAEESRLVTVSAPPDSQAARAGGYVVQTGVESGEVVTLAIESPGDAVWLSTGVSTDNGRFTRLRVGGTTLLSGPYDGDDVRNAAIGSAAGVAIAVIFEAVSVKLGSRRKSEVIA